MILTRTSPRGWNPVTCSWAAVVTVPCQYGHAIALTHQWHEEKLFRKKSFLGCCCLYSGSFKSFKPGVLCKHIPFPPFLAACWLPSKVPMLNFTFSFPFLGQPWRLRKSVTTLVYAQGQSYGMSPLYTHSIHISI